MEIDAEDLRLAKLMGEEAKAASEHRLKLVLEPLTALVLCGTIQLALRHPSMTDKQGDDMRDLAERIVAWLERCGPTLGEVARRGFQKGFDRPYE